MAAEDTSFESVYSLPNQIERNALNTKLGITNIETRYDPTYVTGKRVLITGGNRGIGLALVREFKEQGADVVATVRQSSEELDALEVTVVTGIDVTITENMTKLVNDLAGTSPFDIVVNNAGYFYAPQETIDNLNFEEELRMINICAVGPLRVTSALYNASLIKAGGKVAMITSQGGSITWRTVQNPNGGDYGHHMSKAAANMMGKLLSQELKSQNITVYNLHPGFNRTDMTSKYESIWEIEGAVDCSVGAKRVVHEIGLMNLGDTGKFVNCEDGKEIPW